jgi:NADH-quinone oxidoreductase subunit G
VALSLRQAVRNKAFAMAAELKLETWQDAAIRNLAQDQRSPMHIVAGYTTALADVAATNTALATADQVHLARAIAGAISNSAGGDELAANIARDLKEAERPLIICGTSAASAALVDTAAACAEALCAAGKQTMLSYCLPECNSMGDALLTHAGGASLAGLLDRAGKGELDTLLILENDLFRRAPGSRVEQLLEQVPCVIGLDCLENRTLSQCDWVLPAAAFSESEGTLVNSEGRAQRHFPVHEPAHERRPAWQWLATLADRLDPEAGTPQHFDDICADSEAHCKLLAGITGAAPDHEFRSRGLKIPRQTHRYSGRTAMRANVSVHEPKQTEDKESALAFTMEGAAGSKPAALLPYVWSPGWNSNQSLHKFQSEVGGPLRGGTAGTRLLDHGELDKPEAAAVPDPFQASPGEWQLLSRQRIFGSDELSLHTAGIAELAGEACIEMRSDEAARLDLRDGDGVLVNGSALELRYNDSLPAGCATFSAGYQATEQLRDGETVQMTKAENWTRRRAELIGTDSTGNAGNGGEHV